MRGNQAALFGSTVTIARRSDATSVLNLDLREFDGCSVSVHGKINSPGGTPGDGHYPRGVIDASFGGKGSIPITFDALAGISIPVMGDTLNVSAYVVVGEGSYDISAVVWQGVGPGEKGGTFTYPTPLIPPTSRGEILVVPSFRRVVRVSARGTTTGTLHFYSDAGGTNEVYRSPIPDCLVGGEVVHVLGGQDLYYSFESGADPLTAWAVFELAL